MRNVPTKAAWSPYTLRNCTGMPACSFAPSSGCTPSCATSACAGVKLSNGAFAAKRSPRPTLSALTTPSAGAPTVSCALPPPSARCAARAACASANALRAVASCDCVARRCAASCSVRWSSPRASSSALCACWYALRAAGSGAIVSNGWPRRTLCPAATLSVTTWPPCARLIARACCGSPAALPQASTVSWKVCCTGVAVVTATWPLVAAASSSSAAPWLHAASSRHNSGRSSDRFMAWVPVRERDGRYRQTRYCRAALPARSTA